MVVGPHGQEDGLEYEAAPPVPGLGPSLPQEFVVPPDLLVTVRALTCACPVCRALAAPATGDE